jgi:hypothetical protein
MKNPDCVSDAIDNAIEKEIEELKSFGKPLDEDDLNDLRENHKEKLEEFLQQWIECSEYITIEFDTDENTAKVVKR